MKLERTKNAKKNIIVGMADKVICIVLPFFVKTIIINVVGADYLGLNSLFSSILQVLNLSELGFSSAVVYSMYKPIADGDTDAVCALLNLYRKVYRIIGCIIAAVGLGLMPFLPNLINGEVPNGLNLYILYILYLINTVSSYWLFAYKHSILQAHQRTDVESWVHLTTQVGVYVAQILVLCLAENYYLYVMAFPIFTVINNILVSIQVDKLYPQYSCMGKLDATTVSDIKRQIAGLMVSKICQTTRNSFDSIFISAFIGLTATAIYSNYYYIMNAVIMLLSVIGTSIVAGVGNSLVTESVEKNYNDLKKIDFLYMWISGWCAICLLCLYQPFMKMWVGDELMEPMIVVVLFCLYFYALKMGDMKSVYIQASGMWWQLRKRAIAETVANLVLNVLFVHWFGVAGIIAGTLISLLVISFGLGSHLVFKHYFKNGKLHSFFAYHTKYFLVTAVIAGITYVVTSRINISGIIGLLLKMCVCLVLPNILYTLIYFKTAQFAESMKFAKRIIKK